MTYVSLEEVLGKKAEELKAVVLGEIDASKLGGKLPVTSFDNDVFKQIKKDCTEYRKEGKNGRMIPVIDEDKLMVEVIVAAVHADERSDFTFRSPQLLQKLDVITAGEAAELLLSPGEIARGAQEVQEICGFNGEAAEARAEDVKNS